MATGEKKKLLEEIDRMYSSEDRPKLYEMLDFLGTQKRFNPPSKIPVPPPAFEQAQENLMSKYPF